MTNPARILIVDDHQTNRMKLSLAVRQLGYEAEVAEGGQEALIVLRNSPIDLILLDLVMPQMDGYTVLKILKDDTVLRDIPVIVISALDDVQDIARAIECGAEDHLPKFFEPALLRARLGACLEKKKLRDIEVEYLEQVERLTLAASLVERDDFRPDDLKLDSVAARSDPLGQLARMFMKMAKQVHDREKELRNKVINLQIKIDKKARDVQVTTITETDYFKELQTRANGLRTMLNSNADPTKSD